MLPFLKNKKSRDTRKPADIDAHALLAAQNFPRGLQAALLAAVLAMAAWVWSAMVFDRYFPWVSMLQGIVIGRAMRFYGRGLDGRFPAAAALVTCVAAVLGAFLTALFLTGREFGTGALELVDEISLHTVQTFLVRDFGVVGLIYMGFAAVLAAFFANRRLQSNEAVALRRLRESAGTGARAT